jgi:hypothetical protein
MLLEEDIVSDRLRTETGSVEYAMLEMKHILFVEQSMKDIRERIAEFRENKPARKENTCDECGACQIYDADSSSMVCPRCGVSVFRIYNEIGDSTYYSNYNRNPKHHYRPREHFCQTLLDMTCTSRRKIPLVIVRYCRTMLGRGPSISSADVFSVLQSGGYKTHYASKYEIAAMLRGAPEIVLTPRETEIIRGHYNRYDRCFGDFQRLHGIGKRTIARRTRIYWPVRYVMGKMFLLVGRDDLMKFIRPIVNKMRLALYEKWWPQLDVYVERLLPNPFNPIGKSVTKYQHKRPKQRRVELHHLGPAK